MTLFASTLDQDPDGMALLAGVLRPALTDRPSVLDAMERLRLQTARPSQVYKTLTSRFTVDLDVLGDVLANRIAA